MPNQRKTLQDLQRIVSTFRDERGWTKYHNPKNLVISILVEAAELAEHFQWKRRKRLSEGSIELE